MMGAIILTQKDLFHYVYDLECQIEALEHDLRQSNSKVDMLSLQNGMMMKKLLKIKKNEKVY